MIPQNKSLRRGMGILAFLLLVIGILAILLLGSGRGQAGVPKLNTTPRAPDRDALQAQALEQQAAQASDPTARALLQEKASMLQSQADARATAQIYLPEKPSDPCSVRPPAEVQAQSQAPRAEGIFDSPGVLIPGTKLEVLNFWMGEVSGQPAAVYAAGDLSDPARSVLALMYENSDGGGQFTAPIPGPAHITGYEGALLILENEAGQQAFFDVAAQQFAGLSAASLPTLAPAPTFTPTIDPCGG